MFVAWICGLNVDEPFGWQFVEAQQRGAECTKQVLSGLIDGIDVAGKGNKMYCVDLLPNRLLARVNKHQ